MRIDVLDHGYVELVEHWGSDERIIEAARMSTGRGFEGWDKDSKLLRFLYTNRHMTPFEMGGVVVEVKAPILVFREWHRHRTQSFNEMSARYIPLPDENYMPSVSRVLMVKQAGQNKQAQSTAEHWAMNEQTVLHDQKLLDEFYQHAEGTYQFLLTRGWPKELARCAVPVSRYSRMRASANLRNWLQFLELRLPSNAQWEIRQYANAVSKIVGSLFPRTHELFMEGKA